MFKHPFDSPKRLLVRAQTSIQNFKLAAKEYIKSEPWAQVANADKRGWVYHKVILTKPVPEELADHAYDAAGYLRAALDHTAFATLSAADRLTDKSTHFPISDSATNLELIIKKSCKKVPSDIVDLFRSFEPYKGGNEAIWALNQVCNSNKHRLISAIGIISGGVDILRMRTATPLPAEIFTRPIWDSAKDEMIVARCGKGSDLEYKIKIGLHIAFGEVEGVAKHEVLGALRAMARKVERILLATEAEARRLGIVD